MDLSTEDRLALHELANRYGNAVDDRDWGALATVFDPDARFVIDTGDGPPIEHVGIEAIVAMMRVGRHPVTHHVTNVVVGDVMGAAGNDASEVGLFFKVLGTGPRGRVGSADYRDTARRTADGWRIVEHLVTFRHPEPLQSPETG